MAREREGHIEWEEREVFGKNIRIPRVKNSPQWSIRCKEAPKDLDFCLMAVLEALNFEGISAHSGDATSIVAQMIWAQHQRAEMAEAELAELKNKGH